MITIVVPHYNEWQYLPRLVASLQGQTSPLWRLLIVDDHSTNPEARAYLRGLSQPQIGVLFLRKNLGPAGAMSKGIERVETPFVACLDSDNFLLPGYVERMLDILHGNPELVGAHCAFLRHVDMASTGEVIQKPRITYENSLDVVPGTCLATFRTEVANRCKPVFPLCPDYDMMLRAVEIGPVGYIPEPLVGWEDRKNSLWWRDLVASERCTRDCRRAAVERRSRAKPAYITYSSKEGKP